MTKEKEMSKRLLTADELINELNLRLHQDDEFQEGMSFVPYPEGSSGHSMTGYSTTGPFGLMCIYARVAHKVFEDCELKV